MTESENTVKEAKASGSFGFSATVEKLKCARLGRGSLFLPPRCEETVAKLRARGLYQMSLSCSPGARIAVVWHMTYAAKLVLWEGIVIKKRVQGGWWIGYDRTPGRQFPFPPLDMRVVISGGRVRTTDRRRKDRVRRRKRRYFSCKETERGKLGSKENLKNSAIARKKDLCIMTLNTTTLDLQGCDKISLRSSGRLKLLLRMLELRSVDVCCVQETRLNTSTPLVNRSIMLGSTRFLYFSSADNGYGGMLMISRFPLSDVRRATDRIMIGHHRTRSCKIAIFNVYAPTATAEEDIVTQFAAKVIDIFTSNRSALKLIAGKTLIIICLIPTE